MSKNPYRGIQWVKSKPQITDKEGKVIFEKEVEFPDYFREQDIKIVASKYLCNAAKKEETSLKQMIDRVGDTITEWGIADGYFSTEEEAEDFRYRLKYYQVRQYFAFNSPVYFNVGLIDNPQASACFILSVEDDMNKITDWLKNEAVIFKNGSGSGANLSNLRGTNEKVRGGGTASGPVSFLKGTDVFAGIIKSGGTLRRSAKLACLDMNHPDILNFINCKDKEELKMKILRDAGIQPESGYEMSDEVFLQNTNLSVRINDDFIKSVKMNGEWKTLNRLDGSVHKTHKAKELLEKIAEHAWKTGDPGVQFHDNINKMNPVIADGEIVASNPCSEFMFLNDSSCNLASINLKKFMKADEPFDIVTYHDVVRTALLAQEILVDRASYPIEGIERNTKKYRPLGLGYSNLGALLMSQGYAYDSDEGRDLAALITSLHQGCAYLESKIITNKVGAPKWWTNKNKRGMYSVLNSHYDSLLNIQDARDLFGDIKTASILIWQEILKDDNPVRNAQVSVLAPTGTTSFLMGCDTFGIEPEFALVKFKTLSGSDGAIIRTVNQTVKEALRKLDYSEDTIEYITGKISEGMPIEHMLEIGREDMAVFDTAMSPEKGTRCISYMGHLKMMAAVQPFLSGAISKTVNLPNTATVEDIYNIYLQAWELGLKSVALYRDGSKTTQVLTTGAKSGKVEEIKKENGFRKRMPDDRSGATHKFVINHNVKGYLTANVYDDGELGEFFVTMAKDGSTLKGLMDSLATITSIALQHGVPLKVLVKKMIHRKFEPAGFTNNPKIRSTTSLVDYMFKWLGHKFLSPEDLEELGLIKAVDVAVETDVTDKPFSISANPCPECGALMKRLGSCEHCGECGFNGGACG